MVAVDLTCIKIRERMAVVDILKNVVWIFLLVHHIDAYINGDPPETATHMTCISHNWQNMECDWCPEHEQKDIRWKLVWTVDLEGNISQWRNCTKYINKPGFGNCVCYFCGYGFLPYHECSKLAQKTDFYRNRIYRMRIVATDGKRVSEMKNFTMHLTSELVKPSPVQHLRTNKIESHRIEVLWKHPPRLESGHFPLVYYVTYSSKWNTPKVFNTTKESYTLTDLVPYTDYNITVRCKPVSGGYLSDAMAMVVITKEAAPSRSVELNHGGYQIQPVSCDGRSCRKIKIFWKRIPLKYRNGIISSYIFQYNSTNQKWNSVLLTYSQPHFSYVITGLSWNESYAVTVIAKTKIGPSPGATIFIDKSTGMPLKPTGIEIEYTQNGTGVTVMWSSPPGGATGFSIHHCLGQRDKGCQGDIETVTVAAIENQTRYSVNLTSPDVHDRIFALSTERGRSSSGMTTWQCVYHFDGDPGLPDFLFSKTQQEKSLTIEWQKPGCGQQSRGHILKYKVLWCKVDIPRPCEHSEDSSAEIAAAENHFKIEDLIPDTLYSISVIAVAHGGIEGRSKSKFQLSLVSKPEGSPWNITLDNVTASSIEVSWQPSPILNGRITHHNIYVQDGNTVREVIDWGSHHQATVKELNGFTNYSIQLASCNKAGCSSNSSAVTVLTEIRAPAQLNEKDISVKMKDHLHRSQAEIQWQAPYPSNGPVAYYQVLVWKGEARAPKTYRVKKRSLLVNVSCQDNIVGVNFSVIAVNIDRSAVYKSTPSLPKSLDMCTEYGFPVVIIVAGAVVAGALVIVITLIMCRKPLRKGYENCCGKDKIEVPERQPKVSLTVEADTTEYDHILADGLPPSLASELLIQEDGESLDSALIAARLPPGLNNLSPGRHTSTGSNLIHRDTSPLMSVSSCTEEDISNVGGRGRQVANQPEQKKGHKNRPSHQLHRDINQNKPIKAGNVRLSTATSGMGYSKFDTLVPSDYVTLPEDDINTGSTVLLDTGQTDFGKDSQVAAPVTDYSELSLQNSSEPQRHGDCRKELDGMDVHDMIKFDCVKEMDSLAESVVPNINFQPAWPEEITLQMADIEKHKHIENVVSEPASASTEGSLEQTGSNMQRNRLQTPNKLDINQCPNMAGYVSVTEMLIESDSDNSDPVCRHCSNLDDGNVSPYSKVDQVTSTDTSGALSQSTGKGGSPSELHTQISSDLSKISVSNSRDSLLSSVTKSDSANSSLDRSEPQSSSLEESSPTSGLDSNGSSVRSTDQSPVELGSEKLTMAKRIPRYENRNNSSSIANSGCVFEMSDFGEQDQLQEEIDQRRKNDGYV